MWRCVVCYARGSRSDGTSLNVVSLMIQSNHFDFYDTPLPPLQDSIVLSVYLQKNLYQASKNPKSLILVLY